MDGKLAILRLRAQRSRILTDEARACIKSSLDAIAKYKTYRDATTPSRSAVPIRHRDGSHLSQHRISLVFVSVLSPRVNRAQAASNPFWSVSHSIIREVQHFAPKVHPGCLMTPPSFVLYRGGTIACTVTLMLFWPQQAPENPS
jgi:hypothetical protein